jgi:hypothetical protein
MMPYGPDMVRWSEPAVAVLSTKACVSRVSGLFVCLFLSPWCPRHRADKQIAPWCVFFGEMDQEGRGITSGSKYKNTLRTCDFKLPVAAIRLVSSALELTNTEMRRDRAKHERGSSELRDVR